MNDFFTILVPIFLCSWFCAVLAEIDLTKCDSPTLPPAWGTSMPGRYSVFILLNSCSNQVSIATTGGAKANITYEILPAALDRIFSEPVIESVDIYSGRYPPCDPTFDKVTLSLSLGAIHTMLRNSNASVNTLRLVGVPRYNSQLIQAVHKTVTLVMLQNCRTGILRNALAAVQGCDKLGTLLIYGPAEFKDLWRALYGKKELIQIHLEQNSGSQDAFGLKELTKVEILPKLASVILRCDDICKSNYTQFATLTGDRFKTMTIVSFESNNQVIDSAGVAASRNLGPDLISLSLKGSRPIRCQNMAQIAGNLLLIPKTEEKSWRTMYLKADDDCSDYAELWFRAQQTVGDRRIEQCDHPLPGCRKIGQTSLQIQR